MAEKIPPAEIKSSKFSAGEKFVYFESKNIFFQQIVRQPEETQTKYGFLREIIWKIEEPRN